MKRYIVLFGDTYYPAGWRDYAGEAEYIEGAEKIISEKIAEQGSRSSDFYWWEIVDLETKQVAKRSSNSGAE